MIEFYQISYGILPLYVSDSQKGRNWALTDEKQVNKWKKEITSQSERHLRFNPTEQKALNIWK